MKKLRLNILLSAVMLWAFNANAQDEFSSKNSITVLTSPAHYILGGYHIRPYYHFSKKWSVGATIQGRLDLPGFVRDRFFSFSGDELNGRLSYAVSTELRYRFTDEPYDKGLYTTIYLGYEGWNLESEGLTDDLENWFSGISVGYNWYPFKKKRFHIGANYILIFILNNTEKRRIGKTIYSINRISPPSFVPSILVGWRFSK